MIIENTETFIVTINQLCLNDSEVVTLLGFCAGSALLLLQLLFGITLESNEFAHEFLVDIHHSCIVVEVSAVVLRTEDRYQLLVLAKESIPVLHHLVASANQVQVMFSQELLQLWSTEDIATATLILFPVGDGFVRIVPQQIGHQTLVWNVGWLGY